MKFSKLHVHWLVYTHSQASVLCHEVFNIDKNFFMAQRINSFSRRISVHGIYLSYISHILKLQTKNLSFLRRV